jgi:hypothetical protein
MISAFEGLLTRNMWGEWRHCGSEFKVSECDCGEEWCCLNWCANWDCGYAYSDCEDVEEWPLTVLDVVQA